MKIYIYLIFILSPILLFSQTNLDSKRDYNWCFGQAYNQNFWKRNVLTFQTNPITNYIPNNAASVEIQLGNTGMSDWFGNLLFYSNYFRVINQNHQIMENGDSLNCCTDYFNDYHLSSTGTPQSVLALPKPNSMNLYYLFHLQMSWSATTSLMYSVVDMNLGGGLGKVIQKNVVLLNDTLGFGGLTACRHANGRDWWVLVREYNSNRFHRFCLSSTGVNEIGVQEIGKNIPDLIGQTIFSPDGNKFAIVGAFPPPNIAHIYLYDFDRCTGLLFNPQNFDLPMLEPSGIAGAFSPNSQYLYYSTSWHLYQMNLNNYEGTLIATADGLQDSLTQSNLGFSLMQLAPDNNIYISSGNTQYLHIIHSPDSLGTACNVEQHGIKLKSVNLGGSIPNFPNYRLGREIGSACDTIYTSISAPQAGASVQVYPNPAQGTLFLSASLPIKGKVLFYNLLGERKKILSIADKSLEMNIADLAEGIYLLKVETEEGNVFSQKIIIQR